MQIRHHQWCTVTLIFKYCHINVHTNASMSDFGCKQIESITKIILNFGILANLILLQTEHIVQ